MLETERLRLRPFTEDDLADFARLHADPFSMRDYPAPLTRADARSKLDGYLAAGIENGFTRLHVSNLGGTFLGYTGLMRRREYPLDDHVEIGWRFLQTAWGQGFATEAATVVLEDAFNRLRLPQVLAYTAPDNQSSQAVMTRLGLARRTDLDFSIVGGDDNGWQGLVWEALPAMFCK